MRLPLTGGCLCGEVRYVIAEPPRQVYTCHCRDCQRLTSSAFSTAILVPDKAFRLTGAEPLTLHSSGDSGRTKMRLVCPRCSCWISGASQADIDLCRVRAGTLDDTSWLRPTVHYWTRSKQPWIMIPQGDEVFETQPDA